ncbi:MAG TPA: VanZ family protein, partial [Thermodesulfovibrionales bacterium]|nr:VanZ family protein [Thermodesulfovibrionales bacterium]
MVLTAWLIFLLIASLIPISTPKMPQHSDKVEHFIAYGITSILIFRYLAAKGWKPGISFFSVLVASLYGAL